MRCLWAGVLGQGGCCTSSYSKWVALGGAGQRWDVGCRMLGLCVQGGQWGSDPSGGTGCSRRRWGAWARAEKVEGAGCEQPELVGHSGNFP